MNTTVNNKPSLLRRLVPLIIFAAIAALLMYMLNRMNQGEYNPRSVPTEFIGKPAPAFSLPNLLDMETKVNSSDLLGKVWLLNVWGSWCVECWREHEFLVELSKHRGVTIIGINWRDEVADAMSMLQRSGNPFTQIAYDPQSEAVMEWGVYGAPETFLIDENGIVREKHTGAMNEQVWQTKFASYFR
jgi:cytochrome c biogenesis protein CcmG/thiol:disulfide interchange protein DsbE